MNDYPAAHSMDTEWFALDKHGRVGVFESGEAGAVPVSARRTAHDLPRVLCDAYDGNPLECYVDDLATAADGKVFESTWDSPEFTEISLHERDDDSFYFCMLWFKNESPPSEPPGNNELSSIIRDKPATFTRLPHAEHVLGWAEKLPSAQLQSLIAAGEVLRCWIGYFQPRRLGLFEFEHGGRFENWISGPYIKQGVPARPIRFEDLPEHLRAKISPFQMSVDFVQSQAVQPQDHAECSTWQGSSVRIDGEVHLEQDESE